MSLVRIQRCWAGCLLLSSLLDALSLLKKSAKASTSVPCTRFLKTWQFHNRHTFNVFHDVLVSAWLGYKRSLRFPQSKTGILAVRTPTIIFLAGWHSKTRMFRPSKETLCCAAILFEYYCAEAYAVFTTAYAGAYSARFSSPCFPCVTDTDGFGQNA